MLVSAFQCCTGEGRRGWGSEGGKTERGDAWEVWGEASGGALFFKDVFGPSDLVEQN